MTDYRNPKIFDAEGDLNKQWFVFYFFKHPETGKFERFKIYLSKRLKTRSARYQKAQPIIKEIKQKLATGFNPYLCEAEMEASEALEWAMKIKLAGLRRRSVTTYYSVINMLIDWIENNGYKHKPISSISKNVMQSYFDDMLINENINSRTINNRMSVTRTFFNFLEMRGKINVSPMKGIPYMKEVESAIRMFDKEELEIVTKNLPKENYQLYVITQLIFYCFLRPQEIVRLKFKDLFWDHQLIILPGEITKNGKSETVMIPDQMKENLSEWDLNQPKEYHIISTGLKPGKKEIFPTRIAGNWREFADKYGIKNGIYDLKHTGNGMAFDENINARDIQLQNRHHSLEQTQQYLDKFRKIPSDKLRKDFNGF